MAFAWLDHAVVEETKVKAYLLSLEHTFGRAKARIFLAHGFSQGEWNLLREALLRHAREGRIVGSETSAFGVKYVVEGRIVTPGGRSPMVRSVWFEERDSGPVRLVTAYPVRGTNDDS